MADYIYLLQNRLTLPQWRALEAVREAARTHTMPVFLVGGAVRDLTTGSPVRDLDFAVQGDVRALLADLEGRGASVAGEHPVLSSVYLTFRGGVRVEIGPTLSVKYPRPGQPEAHPAAILDDLRRRDFTANAMAVSLNEGSYGLLLDPLNGTADIENRELRLVSAYGFIEQPALLLRAARLSDRLGWGLEERTQGRYETSKEEGHIQALPAWDRGYELEEIFHEEDPLTVLEHMEAEGWREVLFPPLRVADADRGGLDEVRDLIGQMEGQRLHPDPSAVYFPLITAKLSEENRAALKQLFARQGFVRQIETLEARGKELANQLAAKSTPQPSDAWKLLMESDPEVLLWLANHSRSGTVQSRIKAFLKDWPGMRQKIPYALMQEMRITPDLPVYEQLLDDLFFALIDGKLDTPEATRAFLEPFSPPAPPQVSVRRRPAKSARGRSKRAVAEAVTELEESAEPPEDAEGAEDAEERDEREEEDEEATLRLPAPVPVSFDDDEPAVEEEAVEIAPAEVAPSSPEPQIPTPSALPPAEVVSTPSVEAASAAAPPHGGGRSKTTAKPSPARVEPTVSRVSPVVSKVLPVASKVSAKASAEGKSPPVKSLAASKAPAAHGGAKAPLAAKAPVTLAASKKTPLKSAPGAKLAVKGAVLKKPATKTPVKTTKTSLKKSAPAKTVAKGNPAKAAAKKQPAKAKIPAKNAAAKAVKAAKKTVAKGRSGR